MELNDEVVIALETNRSRKEENTMKKKIKRAKRRITTTSAIITGPTTQSRSEGAFIGIKEHIYNAPLTECIDEQGELMQGSNLVGREIKVGGKPTIMLGGYFNCTAGLRGGNADLMARIEEITRTGKKRFIPMACFNNKPENGARKTLAG